MRFRGEITRGPGGGGELLPAAGVAAAALGVEVIEGQARQSAEVAVDEQPHPAFRDGLALDAGAGNDPAVVGLAGGQPRMHDTRAATYFAVRLALTFRLNA